MVRDISGRIELGQHIPKLRLQEELDTALRKQPLTVSSFADDAIEFKTSWLAPNWYLLSIASSGKIETVSSDSYCRALTYSASLFRVRMFLSIWLLLVLALMISQSMSLTAFTVNGFLVLASYCTAWSSVYLGLRSLMKNAVTRVDTPAWDCRP